MKTVEVLTHRHPEETAAALERLITFAAEAGVQLQMPAEEIEKHRLQSNQAITASSGQRPDLCITLGGDGTILRALHRYIGLQVPVFSINFGRIGFLAAVERSEIDLGFKRALAGEFEVVSMPTLQVSVDGGREQLAINDVAFHRKPELRVAQLSYSLGGEAIGSVTCDGLVAATAAGSTGYNLANGGPILAWGVEGYVISFIAPHTLTARPLLAAAKDELVVTNRSEHEPLEVSIDGTYIAELAPGRSAAMVLSEQVAELAQLPGTNFYSRFREKFAQ